MSGLLRIENRGGHPDERVEQIIRFVHEHTDPRGSVAVRVAAETNPAYGWHGWASDSKIHQKRKWAGRLRYAVRLVIPDPGVECVAYGAPLISAHAQWARELRGMFSARARVLQQKLDAGETHMGRWPITVVYDWEEALVDIAGHEYGHVLQWDRGRGTASEVFCEEYAQRTLEAWRKAEWERLAAEHPVELHPAGWPFHLDLNGDTVAILDSLPLGRRLRLLRTYIERRADAVA